MSILRLAPGIFLAPWRVRQFRRVLRAGLRDPHYRTLLESAGFGSRRRVAGIRALEPALERLPFTRLGELETIECRTPEWIEHPLLPGAPAVRATPGNAIYPALVAPLDVLLDLAATPSRSRPKSELGVLVLRRPGEPAPSTRDRDLLWDVFQVPVYSVFSGFDGGVLAFECEMHRGFHVTSDAVFEERAGRVYFTSLADLRRPAIRLESGLAGRLDPALCDCGRAGPRIAIPATSVQSLANAAD